MAIYREKHASVKSFHAAKKEKTKTKEKLVFSIMLFVTDIIDSSTCKRGGGGGLLLKVTPSSYEERVG
jgi:hypothetical protein